MKKNPIENFGKKLRTNTFAQNKAWINRNWQPRKGIQLVNAQLLEAWYAPARRVDIEANYMQMLQLGEEKLLELGKDKNAPMLVRILARNMLSAKGFDIVERMLDRWIGKAKESVAVAGSVDVSKESMDAIKLLIKQRNERKNSISQDNEEDYKPVHTFWKTHGVWRAFWE